MLVEFSIQKCIEIMYRLSKTNYMFGPRTIKITQFFEKKKKRLLYSVEIFYHFEKSFNFNGSWAKNFLCIRRISGKKVQTLSSFIYRMNKLFSGLGTKKALLKCCFF